MTTVQITTAKALATEWPLLSEINLIGMIAAVLNVPYEQAQAILDRALA
ncbi:MAG: hypothetical protein ACU836_14020 [Gammaproteobacteria bacterium]